MRRVFTFLNIFLVFSIVMTVLSAINNFVLETKLVFSFPIFDSIVVIPSLSLFIGSCCLLVITIVSIIVTKHECKSYEETESKSYTPVYAPASSGSYKVPETPVVKEKIKSSMKKPEPIKSGALECPVCGQFVPEGQNVCVVCNTVVRS